MNFSFFIARRIHWLGLITVLLFLAGCATGPKIDWNSRIGTYTYEQAVLEMGPPDKSETLKDGTKVAEWLTSRGMTHSTVTDFDAPFYHRRHRYPYYYPGPMTYHYSTSTTPDTYLRLIFSPDGRLQSWRPGYH